MTPRWHSPKLFGWDFMALLLLIIATHLVSWHTQKPITFREGKGWDGVFYYHVTEQIAKNEPLAEIGPFVYRIGPSYVATWMDSNDLFRGFRISNIVANTLAALLLLLWLSQYLPERWLRFLLTSQFVLLWLAPLRFTYFYPIFNDPWFFVFTFAGMLIAKKMVDQPSLLNVTLMSAVAYVGVLFRETIILIPLSLFFASNPLPAPDALFPLSKAKIKAILLPMCRTAYFIPLAFAFLGIATAHFLVTQTNDYSAARTAFGAAYTRALLQYIVAWFITYGPLLAVCFYSWRTLTTFLWGHQFLLAYLLAVALFAWFGGWDLERYLLAGVPVVYLLQGIAIKDNKTSLRWLPLAILLVATQLISQRVFWTIPDHPNSFITSLPFLTVWSSEFQYDDLYSTHGRHLVLMVELAQYVGLSILIIWLLNIKSRQKLTHL